MYCHCAHVRISVVLPREMAKQAGAILDRTLHERKERVFKVERAPTAHPTIDTRPRRQGTLYRNE